MNITIFKISDYMYNASASVSFRSFLPLVLILIPLPLSGIFISYSPVFDNIRRKAFFSVKKYILSSLSSPHNVSLDFIIAH